MPIKEIKRAIVYPWSDSKFLGSSIQKETVYLNLKRAGLQVERWKKKAPSGAIADALIEILPGVFNKEWQVICVNSMEILQAIAEICPIVYSLTTHDSSFKITTDELISRIEDEEDAPNFGTNFDVFRLVRTAGLLCWFDVGQVHRFGSRYHYKFSDLLVRRRGHGYATLFLMAFSIKAGRKFNGEAAGAIFSKIEEALGSSAEILIRESSFIRNFVTKLDPLGMTNKVL